MSRFSRRALTLGTYKLVNHGQHTGTGLEAAAYVDGVEIARTAARVKEVVSLPV